MGSVPTGPIVISVALHAVLLGLAPLHLPASAEAGKGSAALEKPKILRVKWSRPPEPSALEGKVVDIMNPSSSSKAPENARFLSDQNRVVERETQARVTGPNPTSPTGSKGETSGETPKKIDLGLPKKFVESLEKESPRSLGGGESSIASLAPSNYLPEITVGDETLLNTREYVYATYFVRMKRQMEGVWNPRSIVMGERSPRSQYTTVLGIILDRRGYLDDVYLVRASGNVALDAEAMAAVRRSAPYLNPPTGLISEDGRIRIPHWHFIVTMGAVL